MGQHDGSRQDGLEGRWRSGYTLTSKVPLSREWRHSLAVGGWARLALRRAMVPRRAGAHGAGVRVFEEVFLSTKCEAIQARLAAMADPQVALHSARYFKTGPGEYGAGDRFRGIRVGPLRRLAKEVAATPLEEVAALLRSTFHEDRLLALLLMIQGFERGDAETRDAIFGLYRDQMACINQWDLVDASAAHIPGAYMRDRDRQPLYLWARSPVLWARRIAIVATFHYIRERDFQDTLALARLLLHDKEDLLHKAVGWMLREVGKRDQAVEEAFLRETYGEMPRMMLRYAIERFPETLRQQYLQGKISAG